MELLITYEEYCKTLNLSYQEGDPIPPNFENNQYMALSVIFNNMAQVHIFPESKSIFSMMKEHYKVQFTRALAFEIKFIDDNRESLYDNPIDLSLSNSVVNYSKGPLSTRDVIWFQNNLSPISKSILLSIGWLYCGLGCILELGEFYNLN